MLNVERKVSNRHVKKERRKSTYKDEEICFNSIFPEEYINKIICADSLHFLKRLPSNCVDVVLTSPEYNFGIDYNSNDDTLEWSTYFSVLFEILDECIRVLKYGGRLIINVQPMFSDYIPTHHIISNHIMKSGMLWKGEILWEKNNYNCKFTSWGSWKSPSNPYLKYTWEFIEVFCKGSYKKTGDSANIDISGNEFKKWTVARWSIAPERRMKVFKHPAMFPEELVARLLKLFSYKNDLILDPFNGVGTTTYISYKLCRKFLGLDISEEYCESARNRLLQTDLVEFM